MTLVCKCASKRVDSVRAEEDLDDEKITPLTASKYLRKVGLKIGDVKMKLGINKIIHYLENFSSEVHEQSSFINHVEREQSNYCQLTDFDRQPCGENKQNEPDLNQPASFMKMPTSKSFLSEPPNIEEHYSKTAPQNTAATLSQAFKFKQVVTKNSLEEPEITRLPHLRISSFIPSAANSENNQQIIQKLQSQNQNLQKCLKNIFNFFEEKKLLASDTNAFDAQNCQYDRAVDQLTCNFIDYQHEIEQRIANLSAKSSLLQENIHNMSISLRIENDCAQKQEENICKSTQTEFETVEAVELLEMELNEAFEYLKEKEILLFIKDEQISSLKVMVSDLQIRLKGFGNGQERVRSKSYKKFFEMTGQNLNNTTR